jgi:hypothetical protein
MPKVLSYIAVFVIGIVIGAVLEMWTTVVAHRKYGHGNCPVCKKQDELL